MSKYIDSMRNALRTYKTVRENAEKHISEIGEYYGKEAGDRERERQEKKVQSARQQTEALIKDAYSEGVYLANEWGKIDGGRLSDDVKLLDAGLVGSDDFEKLKIRHKDNATMLLALKKYGEEQNAKAAKDQHDSTGGLAWSEPYNVRDIVTLPDKLKNWERARDQALDTLDMIDGRGRYTDPWARSLGNAMSDEVIAHFGEGESY